MASSKEHSEIRADVNDKTVRLPAIRVVASDELRAALAVLETASTGCSGEEQ
jgi:hypothetical protein